MHKIGHHHFPARLGDRAHPGFLPTSERLARLQPDRNPFVAGEELGENHPTFLGREDVLYEILSTLRRPDKPGCVSLLGERRIGKTSLLNQVFAGLSRKAGLVAIKASTQGWGEATPAGFFAALHGTIAAAMGTATTPAANAPPVTTFSDFQEYVRHHADSGHRFVLILDEFEGMAGNAAFTEEFFANLRHLGSAPEYRFGFLIASQRSLAALRARYDSFESSSFWNIFGIPQVLGLLQPWEAESLMEAPWSRTLPEKPLTPEDRQQILKWVGPHPAFLQMVLDKMWNAARHRHPLNTDALRTGLWLYFREIWDKRAREEGDVLLRAQEGAPLKDDALLWDLRARGLITEAGGLFSPFFGQFVVENYPFGAKAGKQRNRLLESVDIQAGFDVLKRIVEAITKNEVLAEAGRVVGL